MIDRPPIDIDMAVGPPVTPSLKDSPRTPVRKNLSYILSALFALEIIGAYWAFLSGFKVEEIKSLLLEVLGPTSALLGSAIGFYFGFNED